MDDESGRHSDVRIVADGQETTLPIDEWTSFLKALERDEVQRYFEMAGPEAKRAFRKLAALSPTPAT